MAILRQHWWKILAVLLVAYSLIPGLLWPLKPGIVDSQPVSAVVDTPLLLDIRGYNTHFLSAGDNRVWIKISNEFMILSEETRPLSETHLQAFFRIPPYLPVPEKTVSCALVLDNPVDGPAVKPAALFLRQQDSDLEMGFAYWKKDPVMNLHLSPSPRFPFRGILEETIRNTYYHVPMWFGMVFLFVFSLVYSIRFLRGRDPLGSEKTRALNLAGLVYGLLGLLTGMIWARYTWGSFWSMDVKQNMAAIAALIYLAYFLLRSALEDPDKRDRVSAAYNIFAFSTLLPLLFIIPRMTDSLHPGSGGNPALGGEDLDSTMRLVFYPAVVGWTLLGFWLASLVYRIRRAEEQLDQLNN
jgi:heme exporter protein C